MQRWLLLSVLPFLTACPVLAQGQYQGPPPVAPADQQAVPYQQQPYAQPGTYQQMPAQYQQQSAQINQADPSVPGNSSLSPGEYVLTNRTTGQNMYVTVTPNGQMYTQDAPPTQAVTVVPQTTTVAAPAEQQAGAAAAQQQPQSSKMNVVGGALKGALGMYYQWKYGGSMASSYPMYGGYGYPMYGGYAPNGGGGFLSNVLSRF